MSYNFNKSFERAFGLALKLYDKDIRSCYDYGIETITLPNGTIHYLNHKTGVRTDTSPFNNKKIIFGLDDISKNSETVLIDYEIKINYRLIKNIVYYPDAQVMVFNFTTDPKIYGINTKYDGNYQSENDIFMFKHRKNLIWEPAICEKGIYYINHRDKTTQWDSPMNSRVVLQGVDIPLDQEMIYSEFAENFNKADSSVFYPDASLAIYKVDGVVYYTIGN